MKETLLSTGRLDGRIRVPGSKSYTNRALIAAAVSGGSWVLENPLVSDDTLTLASALEALGFRVERHDRHWVVNSEARQQTETVHLNVGPAGTPARFLLALCSALSGRYVLDGSPRMRKRPMRDLADALRSMGARLEFLGDEGFLPVRITGGKLRGGRIRIRGDVSSQFLSALLLIGPLVDGGVDLDIAGGLSSAAYVDMTRDTLECFARRPGRFAIPGDDSAACFPIAGAVISGGRVEIAGLLRESLQPDSVFREWMTRAGASISWEDGLVAQGPAGGMGLRPLSVNVDDAPDAALPLIAVLSFASGVSRVSGVARLKDKESDRLAAAIDLLHRAGKRCHLSSAAGERSALEILGEEAAGGSAHFDAHDDHRVAMTAAVLALRLSPGSSLTGAESVSKSFPDFFNVWRSLTSGTGPGAR